MNFSIHEKLDCQKIYDMILILNRKKITLSCNQRKLKSQNWSFSSYIFRFSISFNYMHTRKNRVSKHSYFTRRYYWCLKFYYTTKQYLQNLNNLYFISTYIDTYNETLIKDANWLYNILICVKKPWKV